MNQPTLLGRPASASGGTVPRAAHSRQPIDATRRPILLTGAHRSGTTWLGRMLAGSNEVGLIEEPFNRKWRREGVLAADIDYWFQYVCEENAAAFRPALADTLAFRYQWRREIRRLRSVRDGGRMLRDMARFSYHRWRGSRPLMRDPIAVFSTDWLSSAFDMDVVVLIRHPAAFANSLKRRGWRFDFRNFLGQPLLLRDLAQPFEADIRAQVDRPGDIIEQAGLLWRIIYSTIADYQQKGRPWVFVRHEDLSRSPIEGYAQLFARLGLAYTDACQRRIRRYAHARGVKRSPDRTHQLRRESAAVTTEWKGELTEADIGRLRASLAGADHLFYAERDW